jgi:erythromycin esterase-like protein
VLSDDAIPLTFDGERGDLAPFAVLDDLADRARLAYVGEMDHFIAEKYDFRLLCIRYLASRGWRWFGEELAADRGRRVDEYVRTGDDALLEPIAEPPWFTEGILANDRQPTGALDAAQTRFMQAVRRVAPDVRWFGFDADSSDRDYLSLANAARTYEELRPAMALRERIMHAKVGRVLDEHPGEKVALLAAAAHLLKDDFAVVTADVGAGPGGDTDRSIGHHIAHELVPRGEPILSVWMLHGTGTSANPWLPPPGRLRPGRGTFDAELLERVGRPCLVPVSDDHEVRAVTQMHNTVLRCRFDEQVDAIVFVPEVHPIPPA